jgi:8-oxo-dGTP pyrophosphatase MutT (NUDIX family)
MIEPWPQTHSTHLGDYRVFRLRNDQKTSPRTGQPHDFFVLECVDWVNVIALTSDGRLILLEQFRHGTNTVELEIPGGVMDAHDASPVATGIRELREETGYEGEQARILGHVFANPAIMTNTCFTVLIENCQLKHATEWDSGEDLLTQLVPVAEIPGLVASGKIRHSLVVVALYHFDLWQRGGRSADR